MGNWSYNPTYRSYFTPFITGSGAHLVGSFVSFRECDIFSLVVELRIFGPPKPLDPHEFSSLRFRLWDPFQIFPNGHEFMAYFHGADPNHLLSGMFLQVPTSMSIPKCKARNIISWSFYVEYPKFFYIFSGSCFWWISGWLYIHPRWGNIYILSL